MSAETRQQREKGSDRKAEQIRMHLCQLPESPYANQFGYSRTLEETWSWIYPKLHQIPVTRILDVTPIGRLNLPVWSAVTPLAKDLTVHAGKGATALAAKLSAVMEALERVCGESISSERIVKGSYNQLSSIQQSLINPLKCSLPFQSNYDPDREFSWVAGFDLLGECEILVPMDLVISPATEGLCVGPETNGLASGNDSTEAIVHALYELIERDAIAEVEFARIIGDSNATPLRALALDTLPGTLSHWIHRMTMENRELILHDITNSIAVPVFRAALYDPAFPGADDEICCEGYGADLTPQRAILRALSEAAQAHTILTLGSRDQFEGSNPLPDRRGWLMNRLNDRYPGEFVSFNDPLDHHPTTQKDVLQILLGCLRNSGITQCIVVDCTRPDIDVPVVRVIVPGLSAPFGASSRQPTLRLLRQGILA